MRTEKQCRVQRSFHAAQLQMEFIRSPDDFFAGYLQEDSDLEFSGCSEEVSSDEGEGGLARITRCSGSAVRREASGGWSDDEFERDMESELMGLLETVASPDALVAAAAHRGRRRDPKKTERARKGESTVAPQPNGELPSLQGGGGEQGAGTTRHTGAEKGGSGEEQLAAAATYYDNVYFESSSSEEEEEEEEEGEGGDKKAKKQKKSTHKRQKYRKLTNEELFYDPHMDEEDEQWVKRQRLAYHNVKVSQQLKEEQQQRLTAPHTLGAGSEGESTSGGSKGVSGGGGGRQGKEGRRKGERNDVPMKSDALLSCPACMTTVCIDCQQHSIYTNQFRAMFVMNCRISRDEVLKHVPKLSKKERQKRKRKEKRRGGGGGGSVGEGNRGGGEGGSWGEGVEGEGEDYHPVHCAECNTEIAVYDKDEVFHFYNVLASASS